MKPLVRYHCVSKDSYNVTVQERATGEEYTFKLRNVQRPKEVSKVFQEYLASVKSWKNTQSQVGCR